MVRKKTVKPCRSQLQRQLIPVQQHAVG